jgi:hypothetical protein
MESKNLPSVEKAIRLGDISTTFFIPLSLHEKTALNMTMSVEHLQMVNSNELNSVSMAEIKTFSLSGNSGALQKCIYAWFAASERNV